MSWATRDGEPLRPLLAKRKSGGNGRGAGERPGTGSAGGPPASAHACAGRTVSAGSGCERARWYGDCSTLEWRTTEGGPPPHVGGYGADHRGGPRRDGIGPAPDQRTTDRRSVAANSLQFIRNRLPAAWHRGCSLPGVGWFADQRTEASVQPRSTKVGVAFNRGRSSYENKEP